MKTLGIVFGLIFSLNVFSAPPASRFYSDSDGRWGDRNIWDVGSSPSCTPNKVVYVDHNVVISCATFKIGSNAEIYVRSGGRLTINVSSTITGTGNLTVERGGELIIMGDLNLGGTGEFVVDGIASISGDLNVNSGASTASGTGGFVTLGGTGCHHFTGTVTCNESVVLPVQLTYFKGDNKSETIELNWATAVEENNNYFEVLRSRDGYTFDVIAVIDGAGNSAEMIQYTFIDEEAASGEYFYQLRQVDYDGKSTKSEIISISKKAVIGMTELYPNPISDNFYLEMVASDVTSIQVMFYSLSGEMVNEIDYEVKAGFNKLELSKTSLNLESGMYLVKLNTTEGQTVKKVVVN